MTSDQSPTRTVVVERTYPHPPEKVWRALTVPEIMADWLMQTDFRLALAHPFHFRAAWGEVACTVTEIEPQRRLAYTWSAFDVATVVTFTLTPTAQGTTLRMEQSGFRPDQKQALGGAPRGWAAFFDNLHNVLEKQ